MVNDIDNDILISVIAGSMVFFLLCIFIIAFSMLYFKKRKQNLQEREKLASEFAAELLKSQLEIKEQTLQNIGRELHDNLGHTASLIKIYLNTIDIHNTIQSEQKISDSVQLIKQLIKDLKLLSLDLHSDRIIQMGLSAALASEIDTLNKTNTIKASLKIMGNEYILPSDTIIILYRMSQEIINNIMKHSEATEVLISLNFLENLLILVFHDNGLGFNVEEKFNTTGNGLLNLQNRATVINAELSIESNEDIGTTITIQIPK